MQANCHFSAKACLGGFGGDAEIFLLVARRMKESWGSSAAGASLGWEMWSMLPFS